MLRTSRTTNTSACAGASELLQRTLRGIARPGLQRATIIERFDNRRFFAFYVDCLTQPVASKA